MAIHAEVKFRRLVASATSRKIYVQASKRTFAAVVSERNLYLDTSYRALAPEISYRRLHATPSWRSLFLHDVHVNPERTIYFFTDEFSFSDVSVFHIQPSYIDTVSVSDSQAFDVNRVLTDTEALTDATAIHSGKVTADSTSMSDVLERVVDFNRTAIDSVNFAEEQSFNVLSSRSDTYSVVDLPNFSVSKLLADQSFLTESLVSNVSKVAIDALTVAESLVYSAGLGKTDSVGVTEVLTATRNPFSFVYTFGDGFTNVSGSPDDQVSFSDDPQFNVGVALQDFFSLDDFNQIDKEAGANKANVYSMQDEHAFSFSKLADDAFVFADPAVIDVQTTKSDSFSFSDDHSLGFSKSASDSYALLEANTKVFGKTLQDSTNPLTDNAIFAFTKAGILSKLTSLG